MALSALRGAGRAQCCIWMESAARDGLMAQAEAAGRVERERGRRCRAKGALLLLQPQNLEIKVKPARA